MDKFKKNNNGVNIKINKERIFIANYISIDKSNTFAEMCSAKFFEKEDFAFNSLNLIKTIYNMLVTATCSSIVINGVKCETDKDGNQTFNIKTDYNIIDEFESKNITPYLTKYISNYEDVWNNILKGIEMNVQYLAFANIVKSLPTEEKMQESVSKIAETVSKIGKENPELIERIIKDTTSKTAQIQAMEEMKQKLKVKKEQVEKDKVEQLNLARQKVIDIEKVRKTLEDKKTKKK